MFATSAVEAGVADPGQQAASCPEVMTLDQLATTTQSAACIRGTAKIAVPADRVFAVPESGHLVTNSVLSPTGSLALPDVTVARSTAGLISVVIGEPGDPGYRVVGPELPSLSRKRTIAPNTDPAALASVKCSSPTAYYAAGQRWLGDYRWYYKTPSFGGQGSVSRGIQAMATGLSGCGANQNNTATASYGGTTSTNSTVTSSSGCNSSDFTNVIDSGPLSSTVIASTCRYGTTYEIQWVDIKINSSFGYYIDSGTTGCSGQFDLQGILTHEAGHAFGLEHVPASTQQVMKPSSSYCETSQRVLGVGDLAGMNYLY